MPNFPANQRLETALSYAKAGEPILPLWWTDSEGNCACGAAAGKCKPGKHPLTRNGLHDASTETKVIGEWFRRWPSANLGALTNGRPRIDIDLPEVAAALLRDASLPLQTRVVATPHAGLHIAFAASIPTPNRVLFLADGRRLGELKADNAYVVIPPSSIGDKRYELLSQLDTTLLPVEPVAWLASVLPEFGYELQGKSRRDYESLAGAVYEGQGRHLALTSYAGKVWVEDLASETFRELLQVMNQRQCRPPLPAEEVEGIAEHFVRTRSPRQRAPHSPPNFRPDEAAMSDKPTIIVTNRHLHDVASEAWAALLSANDPPRFFSHGSLIAEIRFESARPEIAHLDLATVRGRLDRCAVWLKTTQQGLQPTHPPQVVIEDLMALEKPLPVIRGLIGAPVFAADGSLVTKPGYQAETGLFYHPVGEAVPAVPAAPDATDLLRARQIIGQDWLPDFPFIDDASRAHVIALPLTVLARELIDGPAPLFAFDAPSAGTGKTLLTGSCGLIVSGAQPPVMTETRDNEELRKRLTSLLITGPALVLVDNVKHKLDSGTFAALLTSTEWQDRVLGKSEAIQLPNRAVWSVTGNNLSLSEEILRRTVWIRIDAKVDRPWERRSFRHPDLLVWVRRHRHELLWALLVLAQNWVARGCPVWTGAPLASYESWSRVVGGILQCAEIAGFLANRDELYGRLDSETSEWRGFLASWYKQHEQKAVKAGDLLQLAMASLPTLFDTAKDTSSERAFRTRLGKALAERRDRRFGDLFLRRAGEDSHSGGTLWRLEPAGEIETFAEDAEAPSQSSAQHPQPSQAFSDSIAEDAELADVVSQPLEKISHDPPRERKSPTAGKAYPHLPHVPQTDSQTGSIAAEDLRKMASPAADVPQQGPQCRDCEAGRVDGCPFCEGHLRGFILARLDRARWPSLQLSAGTVKDDEEWRSWLRQATVDELIEVLTLLDASQRANQ